MKKDLVSIKNLSAEEIKGIFILTDKLKKNPHKFKNVLSGKTLALIFQKPSNRTRVSFDVGMYQLGGNSIYLGPNEISLGIRESIKDVARTLSRYVSAIVLRTFEHKNVIELAKYAAVPVINGLSDFAHPCQALADIYTLRETNKKIKGLNFVYVGDGNNVCHSLIYACAKLGINIRIATPKGDWPGEEALDEAMAFAKESKSEVVVSNDPYGAVNNANVVYTDVWTSMGQEKEAEKRKIIFKDYQINSKLVKLAKKNVLVMHCLPAHRGEEITDEVIDGANSVVFDEAENRMHVQKAILIKLLK